MPEPRRFLFVSHQALIHDLAIEVQKEGHPVKYFIASRGDKDVADGFLEKVDDWESHKDWADIVVFDDTEYGETAERLRRQGKRVIGGTRNTDRLENDREHGQEEMRAAGLSVLPHWDFASFDAAIEFLERHPVRYVV